MGNVLICQSPRNPKNENDKLVNPPNESEQKMYAMSKLGENVNETHHLKEQCTYSHQDVDENSDGCLLDHTYEEVPSCTQDFSSDGAADLCTGIGGGAIRQVGGHVNLIGSSNGGDDLPISEGDFSPISSPHESDYSESSEFKIYLSSCSHKETRDDSCLSRESNLWWSFRKGSDPSDTADSQEPLFNRSMTAPIARLKEEPLIHGFRIGQTVIVKHKKLKHDGKLGIIDKWCPVRNRFRINIYNDQAYLKPEDLEHTSLKPIDRKAMQPR